MTPLLSQVMPMSKQGAGNDIVKIDTQGNTNSVNLGAGADTLVITGGEVKNLPDSCRNYP